MTVCLNRRWYKMNCLKKHGTTIFGALVFAVVLGLWLGSWYLIDNNVVSETPSTVSNQVARGVFGDKFGAINALFSGCAFVGIIFTLLLQRKQLIAQGQEIAKTREEMEKQNEVLKQQRFENTLFQLLTLHTDIVDKLSIASHSKREAFSYFIALMKEYCLDFSAFQILNKVPRDSTHSLLNVVDPDQLSKILEKHLETSEIGVLVSVISKSNQAVSKYLDGDENLHQEYINNSYLKAHDKSSELLSHYFRNLYNIFKFIDESELISDDQKSEYARIVRAQLSDCELVAIFYNSLIRPNGYKMEFGFPKMTRLIKKYDITQNINGNSIFHRKHAEIFESAALEAENMK